MTRGGGDFSSKGLDASWLYLLLDCLAHDEGRGGRRVQKKRKDREKKNKKKTTELGGYREYRVLAYGGFVVESIM